MNNINIIYNLGYLFGRISSLSLPDDDKQELCDFISGWYEEERGNYERESVRHIDVCA